MFRLTILFVFFASILSQNPGVVFYKDSSCSLSYATILYSPRCATFKQNPGISRQISCSSLGILNNAYSGASCSGEGGFDVLYAVGVCTPSTTRGFPGYYKASCASITPSQVALTQEIRDQCVDTSIMSVYRHSAACQPVPSGDSIITTCSGTTISTNFYRNSSTPCTSFILTNTDKTGECIVDSNTHALSYIGYCGYVPPVSSVSNLMISFALLIFIGSLFFN